MPAENRDRRQARGVRPHYQYENSPSGIYRLYLGVTVPGFAALSDAERRQRTAFRLAGLRAEDKEWANRVSRVVRSHPRSAECLNAIRLLIEGVGRLPAVNEDQDDRQSAGR